MNYIVKRGIAITIREATENDAENLLETARSNILEQEFILTSPDEFNITVEEEKAWIRNINNAPNSLLLIAVIDNKVVGDIILRGNSRKKLSHSAEIGMGILQEYRDLGIGSLLLEEVIRKATMIGLERLTLQVFAHNNRAIHLYQKFGFQEEGRQLKAIKTHETGYVDNVLMCKYLG